MAPSRVFGAEDSAVDADNEITPGGTPQSARRLPRISFNRQHRPSFISRWMNNSQATDEEIAADMTPSERPLIPSALEQPGEMNTTPLPALSMIVLSITMLGEFLSANVSAPFLLFMVKGFGVFTDDADAGFWTGILASTFFLTQFLTSLLWATVAEKHGQRAVLFVSLLGTAVTCCIFGTSKSLNQAIVIRLLQGIFAGAIGVARGSITFITDSSNEGRAYAILGFCWGFGGVAGAIIGGSFESPAKKWPDVFSKVPLFVEYPYLLPCAVASSITFTGAVLSLFLGYDGGPREGTIRLLPEKEAGEHPTIFEADEEGSNAPSLFEGEPESRGIVDSMSRAMGRKLSSYLAKRVHDAHANDTFPATTREETVPLTSASRPGKRTFSGTSRANGSAYGYGTGYRNRLASTVTVGTRRGSMASTARRRLYSTVDSGHSSVAESADLNFAQRILMANENAVTNIADLWVAAAMNVDNEEVFESDDELEGEDAETLHGVDRTEDGDPGVSGSLTSTPLRHGRRETRSGSTTAPLSSPNRRLSGVAGRPRLGSRKGSSSSGARRITPTRPFSLSDSRTMEDPPSSPRYPNVPTIFSHAGVRTPSSIVDAQELLAAPEELGSGDALAPILESRRVSVVQAESQSEKQPSLFWQLPIIIIIQYGLLALHTTTHDQVFYLYLVTDYPGGGLNLNASHFSQLIALMCLAQIAYQFYLYPPPRGRFSHLAMFRIGSLLFIPSYLSVILYRVPFASATDDGNFVLMSALAISTALRFCGATFAYTAVAILLNYMSPPHVVGLANGIAQSIVSLARFIGPILGGLLWSMSVAKDPSGYPLGFIICSGICAFAVVSTFLIR